jgi:hypothetical protein
MNAILTLKPVTDAKGNIWNAGNIIGLPPKAATTFVAAGDGLDMAGANFTTAPTPDNSAAAVKAPAGADFSLATAGIKTVASAAPVQPKNPKPAPTAPVDTTPAPAAVEPTPVTPEPTPVTPEVAPVDTTPVDATPTV